MREETTLVCVDVKDEIFSCNKKTESEDTVVGRDYDDERKEERVLILSPVVVGGRGRFEVGNRRVTPAVKMDFIVEKALPNGDLYAGGFSSNVPHGKGKYLWSDGCMYEGEWKKGKPSGKGKFSWSSGATYVGEFKSGRMEGFGTFIGSDGDTYRGNWIGDRKQGYGKKCYANGDHYEGMWKKNIQDGQGTYVWSSNGNEYSGEWKNGVMLGCGTLTWANGDRYEGLWENGVMKGSCVCIRADKVRNDGDLCVDSGKEVHLKEVCLVGMAKGNGFGLLGGSGNLRKCPSVDGPRGSITEKPFPRICIWESDGEDGDITCDIIDNVEASMFYHDGTGLLDMDGIKQFSSSIYHTPSEAKKPGKTVLKGHKNYELMLNVQLGIRYTVGKHASVSRQLKPSDFEPKEKFWTRFPPEGSKTTPPHLSMDFRWKDYCPVVFRHLRELFRVDPADYMLAICGNASLRELSSPGKSGSFFYLTQDDKYIIKTVKKSEVKVLIKMLPSYFEHMRKYENSLITKFFGVHCVKPAGGQKTRFIVMGNLFCSDFPIHRRFDLKGSSHGRTTDKPDAEVDETTTLKDLDLNYVFRLQKNFFEELNKQIELDCEFLEAERIMDYSFLLGMHFRDEDTSNKIGLSPFVMRSVKSNSFQTEKFMRDCWFLGAELQDMDRVISARKPLIRLGSNMPARAERRARESDVAHGVISRSIPDSREMYEVVLYFGIIDILQDYDITKKLEHVYKSLQADPTSISAVDPKLYSKRFRDFMKRIFVENR